MGSAGKISLRGVGRKEFRAELGKVHFLGIGGAFGICMVVSRVTRRLTNAV